MQLVNGGDLDSALGLLNGPGVDANGNLLQQKSSWKWELEKFKVEDGWSWILSIFSSIELLKGFFFYKENSDL